MHPRDGAQQSYADSTSRGRVAHGPRDRLRQATYAVDVARDGEEALYEASINDYDAIILDMMIPKRNVSRSVANCAHRDPGFRPDAYGVEIRTADGESEVKVDANDGRVLHIEKTVKTTNV